MNEVALENAIALIKAGQTNEGAEILLRLLRDNPRLERAWEWLYACVKTDEQRIYCLKKVLAINPDHVRAQSALAKLDDGRITDLVDNTATTTKEIHSRDNCDPKRSSSQEGHQHTPEKRLGLIVEPSSQRLTDRPQGKEKSIQIPATSVAPTVQEEFSVPQGSGEWAQKSTDSTLEQQAEKVTTVSPETMPLKEKQAKRPRQLDVALIEPTHIVVRHGDNPYCKYEKPLTGIPDIESGMYGSVLLLGGVLITPHDYPECIEVKHIPIRSHCDICEFYEVFRCPFRQDPTILHEAIILFGQMQRYWHENDERRRHILDAMYHELKAHGRPLHYEVLGRIMRDRYPEYRVSVLGLAKLMNWHPERFEWIERGVYRAK